MSLDAENVVVRFGKRDALRGTGCRVLPGAVTVLIGPNGSGKSTLVRCLAGALTPMSGTVRLDGKELLRLRSTACAARQAFVPQNNPVGFDFTVGELVRLGADRNGRGSPRERVAKALAALDLTHFAARSLLALSGGEQQRAAIARALAQDTPYLLLDEPAAHLDLRHQSVVLSLLRQLAHQEKRGVLMVLHDLNLAAAIADTLVLLDQGRVSASGTPNEALTASLLSRVYQTNIFVMPHPTSGRPWVTVGL